MAQPCLERHQAALRKPEQHGLRHAAPAPGSIGAVLSQITFEGYGTTSYWQEYDANYSRITPVPEPSTYGALLMAAGLGFFAYRRFGKKKEKV